MSTENSNARIGIIGLGYWGKNLLRNLHELHHLSLACDTSPSIIEQRKREFPDIKYTANFDDILSNQDINAVVISTPATTHYEFVKKALLAQKDVFVEKPLSLQCKQGEELVALAKKLNKILMVGHILHYHPAIVKLKDMIRGGELGKIQYIYSNRLNIGKLRVEENILWSFAPHDISVILALIGEEPVKIKASGGSFLTDEIFDVTLTSMEFKNKVKAHIFVSWLHPFKEQKLVIVGSQAMAMFDDVSKEKLFLYPHTIKWEDGKIPVAHKAEHRCIPFVEKEPLNEELKYFIECITQRKNPLTDGEEGLKVLRVLENIEKAMRL